MRVSLSHHRYSQDVSFSGVYFTCRIGSHHERQELLDLSPLARERQHVFFPARESVVLLWHLPASIRYHWKRVAFRHFPSRLTSEDTLKDLSSPSSCNLVILDDLMARVTTSSEMESLFVKGVHHLHLSVLYINQNLYCKGKHSRTINLNTHVYVLMKNPRDVSQLQCLARQAFLGKSAFLVDSYKDATSQPYGYLVLDFSPGAVEAYRVRTKVFSGEDTVVYQLIWRKWCYCLTIDTNVYCCGTKLRKWSKKTLRCRFKVRSP